MLCFSLRLKVVCLCFSYADSAAKEEKVVSYVNIFVHCGNEMLFRAEVIVKIVSIELSFILHAIGVKIEGLTIRTYLL